MPVKTTCPSCGLTCTAPDHLHGKTIKCKRCTTAFAIGSRAQLHEQPVPAGPAPLIPPPKDGLASLPRGPRHKRLRNELIGAAIVVACSLIGWVIFLVVKAQMLK